MIEQALKDWGEILDSRSIDLTFQTGTFDDGIVKTSPKIAPRSETETIEVLRIASKYKIPLHPFASGKNWGYGSASPNNEKSVLLDLSRQMRFIHLIAKLA